MAFFTDQMGRRVLLPAPPKRIISIVPSQTELLFDLGIDEEIVGITKFCIHPFEKVKPFRKVGGTKKLDIRLIRELKPDLIIGNKEENSREEIELLMEEFPVWMSDIVTLQDACGMIKGIGNITGREQQAEAIVENIARGFEKLDIALYPNPSETFSAAYFIWRNPYMAAADGTFINEMLKRMGLKNAFQGSRYPVLTDDNIRKAKPNLVFLSSEPYPFAEKHIEEFKNLCPQAKILLVDGEAFSWYGSRLQYTPAYLKELMQEIRH